MKFPNKNEWTLDSGQALANVNLLVSLSNFRFLIQKDSIFSIYSPKRYIIAARQLLIDRLGKQKRGTDRGLLPNLNANTTFDPVNLLSLVGGSSKKVCFSFILCFPLTSAADFDRVVCRNRSHSSTYPNWAAQASDLILCQKDWNSSTVRRLQIVLMTHHLIANKQCPHIIVIYIWWDGKFTCKHHFAKFSFYA